MKTVKSVNKRAPNMLIVSLSVILLQLNLTKLKLGVLIRLEEGKFGRKKFCITNFTFFKSSSSLLWE